MLSELGTRDHLTAVVHQIREHTEFMTGQFYADAGYRDASRARVERECAAAKFRMSDPTGPADESSDARKNFFDAERLRDIVVRATIDALHFFVPGSPRGQNEHRREDTGLAPTAEQSKPVDFRQSQIEDYRVILFGVGEEIGSFAIGGAVNGVSGFGERYRQLPGQECFVLDDQNPQ